nr:CHASE domain-containing protein [Motiliproteus sediminis]
MASRSASIIVCALLSGAASAFWQGGVFLAFMHCSKQQLVCDPGASAVFLVPFALVIAALLGVGLRLLLPLRAKGDTPGWGSYRVSLSGGAAFLVGALVCAWIVINENNQELGLKRSDAQSIAHGYASAIEHQLSQATAATNNLGSWLEGGGEPAQFESQALKLLTRYPLLEVLQLAPVGVVRQIVPLAGHESALGHDLFDDPERRDDAIKTRDSRIPQLSGPFPLRQGGQGVLIRNPVFNGSDNREFWGFAIGLLRMESLIRLSGLDQLENQYSWVIYDSSGRQLAGASMFQRAFPVASMVSYSGGVWRLELAPGAGWFSPRHFLSDAYLGGLLLAVFVLVVLQLVMQSTLLQHEVSRRTRDLTAVRSAQEKTNWLLDQSQRLAHTGSWQLDLLTNDLIWSDETYRIFAASPECADLYSVFKSAIHPDDVARVDEAWERGLESGHYEVEHRICIGGDIRWVREIAEFQHDDGGAAASRNRGGQGCYAAESGTGPTCPQ